MKVVFTENIRNVAQIGDVKDVADGYARNFLIPGKFAILADKQGLKIAEELKGQNLKHEIKTKEKAQETIKMLDGLVLNISEETNQSGGLYGSITRERLVKELEIKNIKLESDAINLAEPLKQIGEYEIEINPYPEIKAKIKVIIESLSK